MHREKVFALVAAVSLVSSSVPASAQAQQQSVFGYADFSTQAKIDARFLAVPDAKLAGEYLKTLTAKPHLAASPEDHETAEYVAAKFRAAGLETEIVPYRVLLNHPLVATFEAKDAAGKVLIAGPEREHVSSDPFQDDPRVVAPFNGSSGSGDVTGQVVYANYGRKEDFDELAARHVDLHGKIVLVRYGANFRGVKVYVAEQYGAAGVLIYSDPADDGFARGDAYPDGPWRPESAVQRGSVQYLFRYPGDPQTPGVASTSELPSSKRIPADKTPSQPKIPSIPISYHDAQPILAHLDGAGVPAGWQGALGFRYHIGDTGAVTIHLVSKQDYQVRTIWDVIGKVKGTELPTDWVVAGNHRDAWVYGAVDPNSGTAAMLESVRGIGELLKSGWKPKRTIVFASWDAEEEGLMGSTEWVEDHVKALEHAVGYFNMDVGVSGTRFGAEAVPSLKEFVREVTREVPSPKGGTVYEQWQKAESGDEGSGTGHEQHGMVSDGDVHIGDLGSGSDYTPFIQHIGVPSTDVGSNGAYGVYHSVFDNYAWFVKNADPNFVYLQEMARVFGLEVLHMADTDALPYDYVTYGKSIAHYLEVAERKAKDKGMALDFGPAEDAANRLTAAADAARTKQLAAKGDLTALNQVLRETETKLLLENGLPKRPWYKHSIYAPGEFTGYAAVVIPGVNEALDAKNAQLASEQLTALTAALNRAAVELAKAGQ